MLRQALFTNARALRSATRTSSFITSQARLAARPALTTTPLRTTGIAARWYSSETSNEGEKKEGEAKAEEVKAEVEDPLKKKLEAKEKEVVDLKDKYLRLLAEFRTLQDRSARDQKSARDFAIQRFAADLLDSVDNLDRALHIVPQEQLAPPETQSEHHTHLVSLHEGLKLTETILMQALAAHGVTRLDPLGEKFNAADHEVTMVIPHPEAEDNAVLTVDSKGFKLNGRLLRPAKVQVAKKLQT